MFQILMKYVDGDNMENTIQKLITARGPIDPIMARLLKLRSGLVAAYKKFHASGYLHVDSHLRNVMVSKKDEVSLVDFTNIKKGTPELMKKEEEDVITDFNQKVSMYGGSQFSNFKKSTNMASKIKKTLLEKCLDKLKCGRS